MEANRQAHSPAHSDPYSTDDARWMTFAELALLRGTSKRAAVTLVRRHGWRRQRNNEGHVIALVPLTWADPEQGNKEPHKAAYNEGASGPHSRANSADLETALAAIQVAHANEIAAWRERASAAEEARVAAQALADRILAQLTESSGRADQAEKRAGAADVDRWTAEARAELAEQVIAEERSRADALRERLEALQAEADEVGRQATEAQQTAVALRHDLEAARAGADADVEELRVAAEHARLAADRVVADVEVARAAQAKAEAAAEDARVEAQAARQAATKADQDRAAAVAIADEAVRAAEDLRQAQAAQAGQGRWSRLRKAWRGS